VIRDHRGLDPFRDPASGLALHGIPYQVYLSEGQFIVRMLLFGRHMSDDGPQCVV
jgi:hypothetical protein